MATKILKKNLDRTFTEVLTNSAEHGIISQRDFFNKDIANDENIGGYYIVQDGDFVYNPRISNLDSAELGRHSGTIMYADKG